VEEARLQQFTVDNLISSPEVGATNSVAQRLRREDFEELRRHALAIALELPPDLSPDAYSESAHPPDEPNLGLSSLSRPSFR